MLFPRGKIHEFPVIKQLVFLIRQLINRQAYVNSSYVKGLYVINGSGIIFDVPFSVREWNLFGEIKSINNDRLNIFIPENAGHQFGMIFVFISNNANSNRNHLGKL